MFKQSVRDRLLFEDDEFTYSRRYFWAHQTLGIMNEDIQEMVTAYGHCFKERVWNGSDRIVWPGDETTSSRYANWRKRMRYLRKDIEYELLQLEKIIAKNQVKMREIKGLRDNLFSGTSVLESRRSVQQATITVQQGHNIKLLTLVTIFFLPLTFVTSVFGMTNMPGGDSFHAFGIVLAIICLPTYTLIGSLNTTSGLHFWTHKTRNGFHASGKWLARCLTFLHYKPRWLHRYHGIQHSEELAATRPRKLRSQSAADAMAARGNFGPMSPGGPHSGGLLSSPPTFERQSKVIVPTNTNSTVQIEIPKRPMSFIAQQEQEKSNSNSSSGSGAEMTQPMGHGEQGGWLSRLWRRRDKSGGNEKELC